MPLVRRLARPLLASTYVYGGLDAFRHPGSKVPQSADVIQKLAGPLHLPNDPELIVRANGGVQVGAGLMLATGRLPRLSATALALSTVPTTFAGHRFWKATDNATKNAQTLHFLKNLGMLGGLMLAAVDTEGKPSLGWRARRAAKRARKRSEQAYGSAKDKLPG